MDSSKAIARRIVIEALQEAQLEPGPRGDMALTILLEMSIEQAKAAERAGAALRSSVITLSERMAVALRPLSAFAKGLSGGPA